MGAARPELAARAWERAEALNHATAATTATDFVAALRLLRTCSKVSFSRIAAVAGPELPRSTAHHLCAPDKRTLPAREEQVRAFAQGCGATEAEAEEWVAQWQRVKQLVAERKRAARARKTQLVEAERWDQRPDGGEPPSAEIPAPRPPAEASREALPAVSAPVDAAESASRRFSRLPRWSTVERWMLLTSRVMFILLLACGITILADRPELAGMHDAVTTVALVTGVPTGLGVVGLVVREVMELRRVRPRESTREAQAAPVVTAEPATRSTTRTRGLAA